MQVDNPKTYTPIVAIMDLMYTLTYIAYSMGRYVLTIQAEGSQGLIQT